MTTLKTYVGEVWNVSVRRWHADRGKLALAQVVLGSLFLGVLLITGIAVTWKDETALWAAAAWLVWRLMVSDY